METGINALHPTERWRQPLLCHQQPHLPGPGRNRGGRRHRGLTRIPGRGSNQPITTIVPGELVKVRLTVDMPDNATYVIVEDQLPGGLEALNERLNTTSHVAIAEE